MKAINFILTLALILTLLSACSLPVSVPENGIWCCNELKICIDFNKVNDLDTPPDECAKIYDNGDYRYLTFSYGYDNSLSIYEELESYDLKYYISGSFKLKESKIYVKNSTDGKTYIFEKQEEESLLNE